MKRHKGDICKSSTRWRSLPLELLISELSHFTGWLVWVMKYNVYLIICFYNVKSLSHKSQLWKRCKRLLNIFRSMAYKAFIVEMLVGLAENMTAITFVLIRSNVKVTVITFLKYVELFSFTILGTIKIKPSCVFADYIFVFLVRIWFLMIFCSLDQMSRLQGSLLWSAKTVGLIS